MADIDWDAKTNDLHRRYTTQDFGDNTIELAFYIIEYHPDGAKKCQAAVVLCSMIKKGLGQRALQFSNDHPELPRRVHELIAANFMRMEVH